MSKNTPESGSTSVDKSVNITADAVLREAGERWWLEKLREADAANEVTGYPQMSKKEFELYGYLLVLRNQKKPELNHAEEFTQRISLIAKKLNQSKVNNRYSMQFSGVYNRYCDEIESFGQVKNEITLTLLGMAYRLWQTDAVFKTRILRTPIGQLRRDLDRVFAAYGVKTPWPAAEISQNSTGESDQDRVE